MDAHVRFRDATNDQVISQYFRSDFLEKGCADDTSSALKDCLHLPTSKKVQISMDDTSVSQKFYLNFKNKVSDSSHRLILIDIGSCDLHVYMYVSHNIFQADHSSF